MSEALQEARDFRDTSGIDEGSYRGYEIKRQNNKYGHPLIVPALKLTGVNMKDIKALIDRHYLFSIEKDPTEQVDEGTWHIAKDMAPLIHAMKRGPMRIGHTRFGTAIVQ